MNFQNYLKISAVEVEKELDKFFWGWSREIKAK